MLNTFNDYANNTSNIYKEKRVTMAQMGKDKPIIFRKLERICKAESVLPSTF